MLVDEDNFANNAARSPDGKLAGTDEFDDADMEAADAVRSGDALTLRRWGLGGGGGLSGPYLNSSG